MSPRRKNQQGAAAVTLLVLAVSGIYLAYRAFTVVHTVLAPVPPATGGGNPGKIVLVERAEARDLALSELTDASRDPFRRVRRAPAQPTPSRPVPKAEAAPVLRMILYDQLSPEIQLSVGDDLSGRLRLGQAFSGWTVVSISPRSCTVRKNGKTLTLIPRR